MDFLQFLISPNNLLIVGIALVAGILLLVPNFKGSRSNGGLTTADAIQMVNRKQAVWVDVRPLEQFQAGHIAQARSLPLADIDQKSATLPKAKPLIVVCDSGRDANKAAAKLRTLELGEVFMLDGGMRAWAQAALPVTKK